MGEVPRKVQAPVPERDNMRSHGRIRAHRAEDSLFLYLLRMEEVHGKSLKPGSVTARQKEEKGEGVEKRMRQHPSVQTHFPCEMSHVRLMTVTLCVSTCEKTESRSGILTSHSYRQLCVY